VSIEGESIKQRGSVNGVIESITKTKWLLDTRGLKQERRNEFILFSEERGEFLELNNSPEIATAIIYGGLPATRYAAKREGVETSIAESLFGLCRGPWTRRRRATSQQRLGAPACHMLQETQQDSAKTSDSRW